jgi:predicted ATPase
MVFEDLHWIDPTSLELLTLAIDQIKDQRILLVATARLEFTQPWPSYRHISTVALTRLDKTEGTALVAGVTGGKSLPLKFSSRSSRARMGCHSLSKS